MSVFVVAVAACLCGGDVLAQGQLAQAQLAQGQLARGGGPVIASMAVRPDAMQLQAMIVDWIRITATSTQFIVGTVIGVIFAEVGRFVLRWLMRTLAFLNGTFQFIVHYRLMVAGVVASISYAVTHWMIL